MVARRSTILRRGCALWLAAAAFVLALVTLDSALVPAFDTYRWRLGTSYRDVRLAEAAGAHVHGMSVEATIATLGAPDRGHQDIRLVYGLRESCHGFLSFDACELELIVSDGRVSGAAIVDTGASPDEARRCFAGVCKSTYVKR